MNAIAIANNDVAIVAWVSPQKIENCLGFAIYRTDVSAGTTTPLPAWVGFKGESNPSWTAKTTEVWPIQKFHWKDLTAKPGGLYQYRIVPMIGSPGALHPAAMPAWETNPIHLTPQRGDIATYFNRGIFSTQYVSHQVAPAADAKMFKVLKNRIDQPGDPLRLSLAGQLIEGLRSLLDRAASSSGRCYAALYELNDPELEQLLIGSPYVHLILSNTGADDKTNEAARQALEESHVDLMSRMLPNGHIGHNKFVVYADASGAPQAVLTGSTNWTDLGLCGQANNAVIIENAQVAQAFYDYWQRLRDDTQAAGDDDKKLQSAGFRTANQTPHDVDFPDGSNVRIWFSPNTKQKSKSSNSAAPLDLQQVFQLISEAEHAVLFLEFQPGAPSVIDAIASAQAANANLFVRGAVTDPNAAKTYETDLYHLSGAKPDATVVPAKAIIDQFAFWEHELLKDPAGHAIIHDKIVVIDPFSPQCKVIMGSHNQGYRASYNNDENLLIFTGKRKLAEAYAAHVLDIYDHYRFRYQVNLHKQNAWSGLEKTDAWQNKYFAASSPSRKEFAFWQYGSSAVLAPPVAAPLVATALVPALAVQPATARDGHAAILHRRHPLKKTKKKSTRKKTAK